MKALLPIAGRAAVLAERLDALSLRERGLIFAAGVTLAYIAWQTLLMGPLTARSHSAELRLEEARRHLTDIEQAEIPATADPLVAAAARNRSLAARLAALDAELKSAAEAYVSPDKVPELLRRILAEQRSLTLVSLTNLPVESLSPARGAAPGTAPAADDRGPFLHPVEIVVEGDYAGVLAYLRAVEALPWKIHWKELELRAGDAPATRVRIVIGALSLSRDWITV